jgi:hypothetical protein
MKMTSTYYICPICKEKICAVKYTPNLETENELENHLSKCKRKYGEELK